MSDEDAQDASRNLCGRFQNPAPLSNVVMDPRRGIACGMFQRALLPSELKTGSFLAGTVKPSPAGNATDPDAVHEVNSDEDNGSDGEDSHERPISLQEVNTQF